LCLFFFKGDQLYEDLKVAKVEKEHSDLYFVKRTSKDVIYSDKFHEANMVQASHAFTLFTAENAVLDRLLAQGLFLLDEMLRLSHGSHGFSRELDRLFLLAALRAVESAAGSHLRLDVGMHVFLESS
jgi:hypothetical protein